MTCDAVQCREKEHRGCRTCGRILCKSHYQLAQRCGLTCKLSGEANLDSRPLHVPHYLTPGGVTEFTQYSVASRALDRVPGLIGWVISTGIAAGIWWILLPKMLDFADYWGSDERPYLGFFGLIGLVVIIGYFLFPLLVVFGVIGIVGSIYEPFGGKTSPPSATTAAIPTTVSSIPPKSNRTVEPKSWNAIADLSHLSYEEYLRTEAWRQRRRMLLERFFYKCQLCGRSHRLQIHHRTYERLGHEDLEDLTVLCEDCHRTFHASRGMPINVSRNKNTARSRY